MRKGEWAGLALAGTDFICRVTPSAARAGLERSATGFAIRVTEPPENGKANKAALKLLARGLGVPASRLTVIRGQTGRDKVIRLG